MSIQQGIQLSMLDEQACQFPATSPWTKSKLTRCIAWWSDWRSLKSTSLPESSARKEALMIFNNTKSHPGAPSLPQKKQGTGIDWYVALVQANEPIQPEGLQMNFQQRKPCHKWSATEEWKDTDHGEMTSKGFPITPQPLREKCKGTASLGTELHGNNPRSNFCWYPSVFGASHSTPYLNWIWRKMTLARNISTVVPK